MTTTAIIRAIDYAAARPIYLSIYHANSNFYCTSVQLIREMKLRESYACGVFLRFICVLMKKLPSERRL